MTAPASTITNSPCESIPGLGVDLEVFRSGDIHVHPYKDHGREMLPSLILSRELDRYLLTEQKEQGFGMNGHTAAGAIRAAIGAAAYALGVSEHELWWGEQFLARNFPEHTLSREEDLIANAL